MSAPAALAVAVAAGWLALDIAADQNALVGGAGWEAIRVLVAAVLYFGLLGLGATRLLLPAGLREHELLWVVPVGACVAALSLTALGYAAVPLPIGIGLTALGGAALGALAVRRAGWPALPRPDLAWPAYLAVLLAFVALIPMARSQFATVIGDGSDAHLAAGTADFLQDNHPTSVDPDEPIDRVPLIWRSKPPIYYALGSVSTLSGLETWQALSTMAALMLALVTFGWFLLARHLLAAGAAAACAGAAVAGLDRMVLHTVMHPYFNQTWGYFTLPFALVLAWWAVRERSRGGLALLALFLAIGAFAYPLALPIPVLALAVFWWWDRRERRARGEPVEDLSPRRLYRGRRSLLWLVPAGLVLSVPLLGVAEKLITGAEVIVPGGESLFPWKGDLDSFLPAGWFFALSFRGPPAYLAIAVIVAAALWGLRRVPRPLALGLAAVIGAGLLFAAYFRLRDYGWYFQYKVLAFVAPLALVCAVAAVARLRIAGPALVVALLLVAQHSARQELRETTNQLPRSIIELREWDRDLPESASIRLDMREGLQIWVSYMLSGQPLCSERPLLGTNYPHVRRSRKADYVIVRRGRPDPPDAVGPVLRRNVDFRLYRLDPQLPGPENCSRELVQTVQEIGAL